ncbi:MAG TPA: gephyrin-like molybdotransferase receptor GlpR [Mycobacterium sp.]|nr:gephyrin-like molybdotransferase receptor GlpR [Mycobacterium sp.]
MPSIPQSLLWISLVVLWLFVLVPMLTSKREAVRRTSDVALATRVLNSAAGARLLRRNGPAAGHRSDPDWQPEEDEYADLDKDLDDDDEPRRAQSGIMKAAPVDNAEPDYLDVDVVDEDSGALPVGDSAEVADPARSLADDQVDDHAEPGDEEGIEDEAQGVGREPDETGFDDVAPEFETEHGDVGDAERKPGVAGQDFGEEADQYEYIEDTSGLEAGEEPPTTVTPAVSRRRRYDWKTAAAVSARKYAFRKRVLITMALMLAASAATAFTVAPTAWWVCGSVAGLMVLYLAYLRRQTRIEERLRRRRMQRLARSQLGVENTHDSDLDVVPSRLRRPGAVVLEIDDEDPIFEHLDYAPFARDYELPRAVGQ